MEELAKFLRHLVTYEPACKIQQACYSKLTVSRSAHILLGISVVLDLTPNYLGREAWFANVSVTNVAEKLKVRDRRCLLATESNSVPHVS